MAGIRAFVVTLLVTAIAAAPALADTRIFRDGDEPEFCEMEGPCPDDDFMDFKRLKQGHGKARGRVQHSIRTFKRWRSSVLAGRYGITIAIRFETNGKHGADRELRIRKKNGELRAALFRGRYMSERIPGHIGVWRPGRRTIKVDFDTDLLRKRLPRYRWNVSWFQRGGLSCPGSCDDDWAPDRGWFVHRLRR